MLDTDSLVTNRDGIVGQWKLPTETPVPLDADSPDNLELWAPEIRDRIFDFELITRIGFTRANGSVSIWSLEGSPSDPPAYHPLVSLTRPTEAVFKEQLKYVEGYAALRPERATEIHAQLGVPNAFYGSIAYLHRAAWTTELLYAALRLALAVEQRCKHGLACRRPIEYSPQVQPIIPTPRHGTLPSGHATEAFIFAFVLASLLRDAAARGGNPVYGEAGTVEQLLRQAARIAINRQVAGCHFPVDSAAGMVLGLALGEYLVKRCGAASGCGEWTFDGEAYPGDEDFEWRKLLKGVQSKPSEVTEALDYARRQADVALLEAPDAKKRNPAKRGNPSKDAEERKREPLEWLWEKARKEWM